MIVFTDMAILVSLVATERELLLKATDDQIVDKFAELAVSFRVRRGCIVCGQVRV